MDNNIYRQRATLAVALAWMTLKAGGIAGRGFDAGIALKGGEEGWGHVLYIETPGGDQISYHFAPGDAALLDGLPRYSGDWDGFYNGRDQWWLEQYRPAKEESAAEVAGNRLEGHALRRWEIERAKLEADRDVAPAVREAILLGYARRW